MDLVNLICIRFNSYLLQRLKQFISSGKFKILMSRGILPNLATFPSSWLKKLGISNNEPSFFEFQNLKGL